VTLQRRRIGAIFRKELREYRRNRSLVSGMAIFPLIFIIQPLIAVVNLDRGASGAIAHEHVLLYLLGIPVLVPVLVAASVVAGEREQETLEPALTTPIRSEEFLLGKALAVLIPSVVIAYAVFVLYLALVAVFAQPGIAAALIQGPDLVAQIVFTPLLAGWSIWVGIRFSIRSSDVRVAQQLALLASLPTVVVIVIVALNIVAPTLALGIAAAALLCVLNVLSWRVVARRFDRERLVSGSG
jgi:ABC-type transport system involved in multi-copper enzyme maturation permease subunit